MHLILRVWAILSLSADDAMVPVIGYSFESQYITADQPDNFAGWIQDRAGAVKFIRENNISPTPEIKSKWEEYSKISNLSLKDGGKSIEPLLTSMWDQDMPFNYYCPPRTTQPSSGGKALVGLCCNSYVANHALLAVSQPGNRIA